MQKSLIQKKGWCLVVVDAITSETRKESTQIGIGMGS